MADAESKFRSRKFLFSMYAFTICMVGAIVSLLKGADGVAAFCSVGGGISAAYLGGQAWVDTKGA